jgi:hypothetical protein
MRYALTLALASLILSGCTAFGAAAAEEPEFTILTEDGAVQVRQYGELLVAQTEVAGDYDEISGRAFRRLASFIFGDNQSGNKVAMTAPVLQEQSRRRKGEKIAMTAPVLQEPAGEAWIMTFVMPSEYTLETLPRPIDPLVQITTIPPKRVATIQFSGLMNEKKFDRYTAELSSWLESNGYTTASPPRSAGYNPPWTLPPLRRNEIHIDIE